MAFQSKPLDQITETDLQDLINNQVRESKTIEYKENLSGNTDDEKKEFLADVSSFANASGGFIIWGIKTDPKDKGLPIFLTGITTTSPDQEILRLENMIRDGIEPRIPGIAIQPVTLQNAKTILIAHVPRSWALPHMVVFKNSSRFYSRNSAGKYQLDVSEIRSLFVLSQTFIERVKNFRTERLSSIIADETPVKIQNNPKIVLHLVPINSFSFESRVDLSLLHDEYNDIRITFRNMGFEAFRYNLDGILAYLQRQNMPVAAKYIQIFRNGIIEIVDTSILGNDKKIPSEEFEDDMVYKLKNCLFLYRHMKIEPPLFIFLSLLNVLDYHMEVRRYVKTPTGIKPHPIDRENLIIPEIMIENFDIDPSSALKPIFDMVWNAAGWPRSMYDEDDK